MECHGAGQARPVPSMAFFQLFERTGLCRPPWPSARPRIIVKPKVLILETSFHCDNCLVHYRVPLGL